jgi:GT2 family glycosyltransferase
MIVPSASIIIVSHGGLDTTTAPCLESIFRNTVLPAFEVIVVDNASPDSTPAYLEEMASREPRLRYLLNVENRGFAGGNNDGIRMARGEYLVLINSDTLVMEGWLEKLVHVLRTDSAVGLVGPVSNSVGNEQRIFTREHSPERVLEEASAWCRNSEGDFFGAERLGFFCVAMRKDVIERVGLLDESFGLGFFEDDDYCIRVRNAGYRLVCLEDVFVYHRGSASYGRVSESLKALLKKNRRILEKKIRSRYKPSHPRDRQLDLAESYLGRIGSCGDAARIVYKIRNRLRAAEEARPRGVVKRILFEQRIRTILAELAARVPAESHGETDFRENQA